MKTKLFVKAIVLLLSCSVLSSLFTGCNGKDYVNEDTYGHLEESNSKGQSDKDNVVNMKYDDRFSFDDEISKIVNVSVTSKKVNTDKPDDCVLSIVKGSKNKKVVAEGVGKAEVVFKNGNTVTVEVESADISMLLIIGQSNAEGQIQPDTGNFDANTYQQAIDQSILCEEGQVYSTYAPGLSVSHGNGVGNTTFFDTLSISTYERFVASSLTSNRNSQGRPLSYPLNSLTATGQGKTGVDSGIAYKWNEMTGEKVWVINAAHGGSKISTWQPGVDQTDNNFWQAVKLFGACQRVMKAEIAAGHYNLKTMGYFWLQGEADMGMTADEYMENYKNMHMALKEQLIFDKDLDGVAESMLDFGGIMMVRSCIDHTGRGDLQMRGVRIAQYCMGQDNTGEFRDVYLASTASEYWTSNNEVQKYFSQKYGSSYPYEMRNYQGMATTMTDVHPNIHYRQLGYNEVGLTSSQTIVEILGGKKADTSNIEIKLLKEDGYTEFSKGNTIALKSSSSLVAVPKCMSFLGSGDVIKLSSDIDAVSIKGYTIRVVSVSKSVSGHLYVKFNGETLLTFNITVSS